MVGVGAVDVVGRVLLHPSAGDWGAAMVAGYRCSVFGIAAVDAAVRANVGLATAFFTGAFGQQDFVDRNHTSPNMSVTTETITRGAGGIKRRAMRPPQSPLRSPAPAAVKLSFFLHGSCCCTACSDQMSRQEPKDHPCDLIILFFEREMPGVEQVKLCLWKIALERLGTRCDK